VQRSKIDLLPADVRATIDQDLIGANFSDYEGKATAYTVAGLDVGGRSGLHRYGQRLQHKIAAIKATTEASRMIAEAAKDDEDQRSAAVIALIQSDLFEVLLALQEAADAEPAERMDMLVTAAHGMARLTAASVHQKKHALATRRQAEAAAGQVQQLAQQAGLSGDTVAAMREAILGALGGDTK
jgi:hypothetical protein